MASLVFTGLVGIITSHYSVTPVWYLPGSKQPSIKLAYVGQQTGHAGPCKRDRSKTSQNKRLCAGSATGVKGLPSPGLYLIPYLAPSFSLLPLSLSFLFFSLSSFSLFFTGESRHHASMMFGIGDLRVHTTDRRGKRALTSGEGRLGIELIGDGGGTVFWWPSRGRRRGWNCKFRTSEAVHNR